MPIMIRYRTENSRHKGPKTTRIDVTGHKIGIPEVLNLIIETEVREVERK